jgi:hypothetical protein
MVRRGPAFVFARKSRSKLVFEDCPDRVRPPPRMPDDDPAVWGYLVLPSADVVSVRRVREARVFTFWLFARACVCFGRAARCVLFNGWRRSARGWPIDFVGETLSDADVTAEVFTRGSDVVQAMDHTNPANSRAIAVTTTGVSWPFAIMCR